MDWAAWTSLGIACAYLFTTERYFRHPTARGVAGSNFDAHSSLMCWIWWSTCLALPLVALIPPVSMLILALPGGGKLEDYLSEHTGLPLSIKLLLISTGLCGTALRYWAMSTLGHRFTSTLRTVDDHSIASSGPYAWVRHPGYAANGLVMLPFPILASAGPLVPLLCAALYVGVYTYRIRWEEKMLCNRMKDAYERYKRTTSSRLVPFIY